ncbi:MAG: hypothetical protein U0354_16785 [Candidatus Sericytochromatia bacterium]
MGGHGGHDHDEGDEIVLHQERLLPTMLLATGFALIVLFGLASAGGTRFDATVGKAAYEKVVAEMPKVERHIPLNTPNAKYHTSDGKDHNTEINNTDKHDEASVNNENANNTEAHNESDGHEHGH